MSSRGARRNVTSQMDGPTLIGKALQNSMHHAFAKSGWASRLAVKIRNQANCVIAYHLGETPDPQLNGEFAVIEQLAPHVKSFIDVGANVGEWSEYLLQNAAAEGFLYEPSASCVSLLRDRFRGRAATIRPFAVSDAPGTAAFAEEENYGMGSSLAEAREASSATLREVRVTTLDAEFPEPGTPVDLVKIDTEGYDLKVMKGAAALLSRTRFLQFEYNSHWVQVGSSLAEANRFLSGLGFSVFLVRSTGLHPLRYEYWGDFFRYSNFFACRPTDFDRVRLLLREPI